MRTSRLLLMCFSTLLLAEGGARKPARAKDIPPGATETSPADTWEGDPLQLLVTGPSVEADGKSARLSFELLALDRKAEPLLGINPDNLALRVDGRHIPGTWTVRTFREAGGAVAVGVLVHTHPAYTMPVDSEDPNAWAPIASVKEGLNGIMPVLSEHDRIAVFVAGPDGAVPVAPFGSPEAARAAIEAVPVAPPANIDDGTYRIALTRSVGDVARAFGTPDNKALPARRLLLTITDGKDPVLLDVRAAARAVNAAQEALAEARVLPWVLGFSLDVREPLLWLKEIASKARGRYQDVAADDYQNLTDRIIRFGLGVYSGFVVTFTPAPGVNLPAVAREVRLSLRTSFDVGHAFLWKVKLKP